VRRAREIALEYEAPAADRLRLTPGDFAPHNVLFDGGGICVVDWESAGWEDPAVLVCDFLLHETTRGLARPLQNLFLETYFAVHPPSQAELARWRQVYFLVQVGWILGFLNAFQPAYLE